MGNAANIVYRSLWERKVMVWLDTHDSVIGWCSEEFCIPYISPVDSRPHRYFPDFLVRTKDASGKLKTSVWEVKPISQSVAPTKPSRVTKRYITEVMTYGVNQAKWKAAQEYCADRGWEFVVLTEKELGIKR